MRRLRLGAFGAICAVVAVGAATGIASADSGPSASATQGLVAGSPTAIACGGSVDARVTVTGTPGTTGQATDVVIVVDLSGSTGVPSSKLQNLEDAATDTLRALDAADGTVDSTIGGNAVGLIYYRGASATTVAPIGSSYGALTTAIMHLPTPSGGSPHDAGINAGSAALATSTTGNPGKSLILISDGQATGSALSDATSAASNAKTAGVRIVPFGIGISANGDPNAANLKIWGSDDSYYQDATAAPISRTKLVGDLGAATLTPVSFALTETLGSTFSAAPLSNSTGTVTTGAGTLQWQGTLTGPSATLTYRATRNGSDIFSSTNEVVSTLALAVTGGTASVTPPASLSIGVLPCGGTLVAATTCTGALCTASGTSAGQSFTVDAGNAPAGTSVVVAGLSTQPPPGVCPGFDTSSTGIEFDISPFTRDATFQYTIPRSALGNRKWWQLDVCLGTNLKFTTAITSFATLRPGARLIGGGTVPGRWWGLLPSIPRSTFIPGLGVVRGPYISRRTVDRAGNATVKFVVPFVPGSAAFTTDGKPGYDPKRWG